MLINAKDGKVFRRISDGFIMGSVVDLGIDYSTGVARDDKPEYYEEVESEIETEK